MYTEGLKKSRASAPVIVLTLIERTAPLRERLREDLAELLARYRESQAQGVGAEELGKLHKRVGQLQKGSRSPWIFLSYGKINWLEAGTYDRLAPAGMGNAKGWPRDTTTGGETAP